MNIQQFLASDRGTRLWMALAQSLPRSAAYAIVNRVVDVLLQRRHTPLYRAIYYNQGYVLSPGATAQQIHRNVGRVLRHGGYTSFDLMHAIAQGEAATRDAIEFSDETQQHADQALSSGHGVMVCGAHLSNFNLGLLSFSLRDIPIQILSRAQPTGGFKLMADLRDRGLLDETPIDGPSLRKAIARLRAGGVVGTAADWPLAADTEVRPLFFGRPALLPTGHIRIALSADALLMPVSVRWTRERGYHTVSTPPMALERTGDRLQDVIHNARRVLSIIEGWVAERPDQWLMYYPVWPEQES